MKWEWTLEVQESNVPQNRSHTRLSIQSAIAWCGKTRARQLMRRKQTAVEAGAPSRLQGPPPPTRAPILEKWDRAAQSKGWKTFRATQRSSTSTSGSCSRSAAQRDSRMEKATVLQSLSTIDGQRVTEDAYAFRKCTSCADDHLVMRCSGNWTKTYGKHPQIVSSSNC